MGVFDKAKNKAEELTGRGKEAAGAATDNQELKDAGKRDQLSGQAKQTAQDVSDKASGVVKDVKDKFDGNDRPQR